MFCVKCGEEGETYKGLCPRCFLESKRFTSVPEFLDLFVCAHCDEYLIGKRWVRFDDEDEAIRKFVSDNIKVDKEAKMIELAMDIDRKDEKNVSVHLVSKMRYGSIEVEEISDTTVRTKRNVCPKCNKIQGNYFESIVQVRPSGRKFTDEEKETLVGRVLDHVEKRCEVQ